MIYAALNELLQHHGVNEYRIIASIWEHSNDFSHFDKFAQ
jgi:hypothetical protein